MFSEPLIYFTRGFGKVLPRLTADECIDALQQEILISSQENTIMFFSINNRKYIRFIIKLRLWLLTD